jgi:non-ribosomal peptide synthetase component F
MTAKSRLLALGGATEGGIWSNCYETLRTVDYATFGRIPYGLALPGQTMVVLDFLQRICPLSVVGTIYIGGHSLASGYWHDPERTTKSFVIHPTTGERLYNTGDMGR